MVLWGGRRTEGRRGREEERTDQAALLGVALAAVIALVVVPGEWVFFSTMIGLTLLGIVAAYYRPKWPPSPTGSWQQRTMQVGAAATRAFALGGVIGLCASLALGYPLQQKVDYTEKNAKCWKTAVDSLKIYLNPSVTATWPADLPRTDEGLEKVPTDLRDRYSNCLGGIVFNRLPGVWFISLAVVVAGYMVRWWQRSVSKRKRRVTVAAKGRRSAPAHEPAGGVRPPTGQAATARQPMDKEPGGGAGAPSVTSQTWRPVLARRQPAFRTRPRKVGWQTKRPHQFQLLELLEQRLQAELTGICL